MWITLHILVCSRSWMKIEWVDCEVWGGKLWSKIVGGVGRRGNMADSWLGPSSFPSPSFHLCKTKTTYSFLSLSHFPFRFRFRYSSPPLFPMATLHHCRCSSNSNQPSLLVFSGNSYYTINNNNEIVLAKFNFYFYFFW